MPPPPSRRGAASGGPSAGPLLCLLVLDAEGGVRERPDPGLLDRPAASLAQSVVPLSDPLQGMIDLLGEVLDVVRERQITLSLEGRRAGVRVLLVEGDLP